MSLFLARFIHATKRTTHGFAITCAAVATLAAATANAAPAVPAEMLRPVAAASSITEIAAKAARASATYEPELMRSRAVQPDIYLLMQTAARLTLAPGAGNAIRVGFFDDTALVVDFTSAQQVGDRTVLSGSVPGIVRGTATFVVKNGTVVGNVHALDRVYQLRFRDGDFGNGVIHESREIDPSQFRDHDRNYNAFVKQEAARERKAAMVAESNDRVAAKGAGTMKSQSTEVARDDGSVVDMLVAYTTNARIGAGGTAAINSLIELAIAESNVAYQNSSVVHRLRLLKTLEVNYVETGASSTDLNRLRGKTDKFADEVHAYRAAYGADIVSLFVERMDDACGIGYLMTNVSAAFAVSAFNVVARRCVSGTFTFAHEVGHNMGLRHDTFEDSGTTPFPDAHGYVELTARYRTVMAYNDACVAQGFSCRRTANFSNPDILVDGVPSGVLGTANAARVLNATRTTAANFVQAADLSNGGPILLVKTSYSGAEGTTVQMVVERISGAPGAASVRYATVAGTATAGVDFAPNSGTISWGVGDFAPKTISLVLLQDSIVEASEFFTVVLSDAVGATLGSSKTATIAILDDEPGVFPPNCAMPSGWTNSAGDSTLGWVVAVDSSNEGRCSLKSGPIGDSGSDTVKTTSRIAVTGDYLAGTIRFARRVSSEDTFDCFRFTIDGVQQNVGGQCSEAGGIGASGEVPWGIVEFPVSAGRHTFMWSYEKDANTADGDDAVWIDEVQLPPPSAAASLQPLDYTDLWWSGETENGWGMSITQHAPSNVQFIALYVYEANGTPTWYVLPGGTWNADFTVYTGLLYRPTGTPADNYNANQLVVGASVGNATLRYTSANTATITYTIQGVTASKNVIRQSFGVSTTASGLKVGDMWWGNTSQNGWGVSISQQFNTLFAVWYTYDATGKATWYVMPGGAWTGNTYIGTLYSTTSSPWLGTTYNASQLSAKVAGSASFTFTPDVNGTTASVAQFAYVINASTPPGGGIIPGFTQDKRIVRQGF